MKRYPALKSSGIITITTDFGIKDSFVGQMKGVILSVNKKAQIIDITHEIEPFSVIKANYTISEFYKYFPQNTVHICIVDPGVGSTRRGLVISFKGHYFVGPDNGIFTDILSSPDDKTVVEISNTKYILRTDSPTFQGRDVFAPVAGWLSRNISIDEFGSPVKDPVLLAMQRPQVLSDMICGRVILIDRFGNCITDIKGDYLKDRQFQVFLGNELLETVNYYEEAEGRGLSCIINSSGYLELFVYRGRASDTQDIKEGQMVTVRLS